MEFPIAIHKDRRSDFGVIVPDLPGCFSAGRSINEAMTMAREAIELHLEGMLEDGKPIPTPMDISSWRRKADFRDAVWAMVSIDPDKLPLGAQRVNITMPKRILDSIDRFADERHQTRSGLLVKAASEYIERHRSSEAAAKKA